MGEYKIRESVGRRLQDVHTYRDIEKHHPSAGQETNRNYRTVDGEYEEILSVGGKVVSSRDGHVFVSKDLILFDKATNSAKVTVPSPAAGFIKINQDSGLVKIYDKLPNGEMIAQVRHMDLRGFTLKDGDYIEYGQPMGVQAGMGRGNVKAYGTHTHIDFNANHLDKFKQYIRDMDTSVITTDRYPKQSATQPHMPSFNSSSRQANQQPTADGILRRGEQGNDVRGLQQSLTTLGYRDAQGHLLKLDSDYGPRTKEAVEAYQRANGLHVDGIAGKDTLESIGKQLPEGKVTVTAAITGVMTVTHSGHPDHALFKQSLEGLKKLDLQKLGFHSELQYQNAAASLTFEAKVSGLKQIDHVVLSTNGTGLFAVQGRMDDPTHHRIYLDKAQAASQPIAQSTQQLEQETQRQQTQYQQQAPSQVQAPRPMSL
ncbi:MAG: peptidoglycan-binding protein [Rhodoferax sp.]|nr:peptidoglycan-binding protein [Rhodoferax sp.]